ncbi:MAG: hypothetical protein ACF8QF_02200 [Phycisphaerales bacterium]
MAGSEVMTASCACGMAIRYRAEHIGRTVKCRSCGGAVALAGPQGERVWFNDDDEAEGAYGIDAAPVKAPGASPVAPDAVHPQSGERRTLGREKQIEKRREAGFWRDSGRAFVFWMTPSGAIGLIVITAMLLIGTVLAFIPLIGLIVSIIVTGLVWGFYLEVIQNTAGGDDDLPDPSTWDGVWDSVIVPIATFLTVTLVCALPALGALFADMPITVVFAAGAFGAFLWPVTIMTAAIGGAGAAIRLDLLVRTVFSAFVPYLCIWLMLTVATFANWMATAGGEGVLPPPVVDFLTSGIVGYSLGELASVYTSIVSMKLIGLYYRHYSDRFPWDAG